MSNGEVLICEAHVKRYILKRAVFFRPGWPCRRVSDTALEDINTDLRIKIDNMIKAHPTLGVTFQTRTRKRKKE